MSNSKNDQHKEADHSSKSRFYRAFFESLLGNDVKIYRGGPEAKHGVLVDVQSDYVALSAKHSVIYYQVEHIKSISVPTKPKPPHHQHDDLGEVELFSAKSFHKLLKKMENQVIKLNQGGPESIHGMLLSVRQGFVVVDSEDDGLVYVNPHHIKSVSLSSKEVMDRENMEENMITADDLYDVLHHFENKWVSINRGGPEAIEGVLFLDDGYYKLTRNEEVIRVDPFHIRSVSSGPKGFMKKSQEEEKDENKKEEQDNGPMDRKRAKRKNRYSLEGKKKVKHGPLKKKRRR
ncbi:hypothetical protein R4Z09_24710 [Niallia oryzisoli]|uniref:Spore coat protein n=1 Tax=Niallia oryzisoli TaxID=1737571 RepID=A0ABZ2CH38_9BACI